MVGDEVNKANLINGLFCGSTPQLTHLEKMRAFRVNDNKNQ